MAKTIIHKDHIAYFGDEPHLEAATQKSFTQFVFELLSEKSPKSGELELFELILNLSIDHGPETPSAIKTIEAAKHGKTVSEALAAGLLEIGDTHGGAAEPLMEELYRIKNQENTPLPGRSTIKELVSEYLGSGKRLPGFGHRIYKDKDPRSELILSFVEKLENGRFWINLGKEVEKELNLKSGKQLPMNIDGAIAVALCALGLKPELGKIIFIIARVPGLCGQYLNNI